MELDIISGAMTIDTITNSALRCDWLNHEQCSALSLKPFTDQSSGWSDGLQVGQGDGDRKSVVDVRLVTLLEAEICWNLFVTFLLRTPPDKTLSDIVVRLLLPNLKAEGVVVASGYNESGADVE